MVNWRDWELCLCGYYSRYKMKDINYKIKHIRMNEKTWKSLKEKRKRSGLSWNLFLVELLNKK